MSYYIWNFPNQNDDATYIIDLILNMAILLHVVMTFFDNFCNSKVTYNECRNLPMHQTGYPKAVLQCVYLQTRIFEKNLLPAVL